MYIVLLSGGSGKRLWPLSNDLCSKQYIKLMNHDSEKENREKCSMLQRVFGQLETAGLSENTIVCASSAQVELIESQLNSAAEVAVEPMRRDTFPAVMLSCAYLLSKRGAKADDVVAFLPVDPYTTGDFSRKSSVWEKPLRHRMIPSVCSAVCRLTRRPSTVILCRSRERGNS